MFDPCSFSLNQEKKGKKKLVVEKGFQ